MSVDFNEVVNRRTSDSIKWRRYDEDVLPLWVADMDFLTPSPIINELKNRVEHRIFGYSSHPEELLNVIRDRLFKKFKWNVETKDILIVPGVMTGVQLTGRAIGVPENGIIFQKIVNADFFFDILCEVLVCPVSYFIEK